MPRKARLFSPDVAYHIIARGNNRQTLFRKTTDFERYLFFLKFLKSEFAFDVFHYCLMSNHVHLLMRFSSSDMFRKVPQRLMLLYAKYFAREYRHVGHVFQDRFKSIPVKDNSYLLECGRYIERNPLKAHIVSHPIEYPWSSAGYYLCGSTANLITENPLYKDLATVPGERRRQYETYLLTERPYEEILEKAIFGRYRVTAKVSP